MWCIRREFSYESIGERISKIDPHLPTLLSNIYGFTFLRHVVDIAFYALVHAANIVKKLPH